jgi:glycosyltransferase involved in cell wall biosynthesis
VKVLHAAASIAPRDGGPSTATLGINRELAELGVNSLIVTTDADGARGRLDASTRTGLRREGGAVLYCKRSRPFFLKNSWRQGMQLLRGDADLVHVHGVYLANSIWAYLGARLRGTAYVVQPHGTLEPYQQGFARDRKRWFDQVIGNRILDGAAAVIAASSAEAAHLQALLPAARVVTVPLGVTRRVPSIDPAVRAQLGAWLSAPPASRVLFLGRLAAKKRPDLLIDAWNQRATVHDHGREGQNPAVIMHGCTGAQLLIVGPAQDWDAATLSARVSPELRGTVTFVDAVSPDTAAWLMSAAGIFALPSENENFAISVAEAMVYGCAVVTTEQTAAGEHVVAAEAGLVLPRPDAGLLREALAELLADPQRTGEMGERGRVYAEAELTWASTAARLSAAYTGLVAKGRRP